MKINNETYISIDIEADGPIPGPHSMLSLGAVAYDSSCKELGKFSVNLERLTGSYPHPDTEEFWKANPAAYEAATYHPVDPKEAMEDFLAWLNSFENPVLVAYPAGFDFTFIYWYAIKFCGIGSIAFSCIDMKTLAMAILKLPYKACSKRNFPKHWFSNLPHNHIALDDAIEQGHTFKQMLNDISKSKN